MDIVLTGATGVIGRRTVRALVADGHAVTGVVRSDRAARTVEELGARAVRADVFDSNSLARAFAGRDVVVNLLTRIPTVTRMALPGAWRENDRLRRLASAAIARAAAAAGTERLVQESIALLYADGGERRLAEDAPIAPAGVPAAAADAEHHARGFPGASVVLRFGLLVAAESDQTQAQLALARRGLSTALAPPHAYVPTVWADDAGRAVAAAVVAPDGTYNVTDDDPPTRREVDAALAAVAGRRRLVAPLPAVARHAGALEPLTRSLRPANDALRARTGWAPRVRAGVDGWRIAAAGDGALVAP